MHKAASDSDSDDCIITMGNEVTFRRLVGVLDAVLFVQRDRSGEGGVEQVPAFAGSGPPLG